MIVLLPRGFQMAVIFVAFSINVPIAIGWYCSLIIMMSICYSAVICFMREYLKHNHLLAYLTTQHLPDPGMWSTGLNPTQSERKNSLYLIHIYLQKIFSINQKIFSIF